MKESIREITAGLRQRKGREGWVSEGLKKLMRLIPVAFRRELYLTDRQRKGEEIKRVLNLVARRAGGSVFYKTDNLWIF